MPSLRTSEDEVKDQEDFHGDIGLAPAETAKTLKNPKSLKTPSSVLYNNPVQPA